MELSIPYTLVGPDGTRAVIGNSDAAVADPDWVGFIDPDAGIVGLDGAEVRENADVLVEQDGGIHGAFYEGRRAVIFNVVLDPRDATKVTLLGYERRLRRACRALRDDTVLTFTPSDLGVELRLLLRRNAKPVTAGRIPKTMQIPMVSADSALRASAESNAVIAAAPSGIVGYTSPYVSPYGTTVGTAAFTIINNTGELDAIPRFELTGPMTSPQIVNNTTGKRIVLNTVIATGETLLVDVGRKTVELVDAVGNVTDAFRGVVYPDSKWWRLAPGSNDVRLIPDSYSGAAAMAAYWRPAYE